MVDSTNETLLIFVRNAEKGRVKTRLARTVGDDKALAVYNMLLTMTKSAVDPLEVNRQVWYDRHIANGDIWSGGTYGKKLQRGEDLGARMKSAFHHAFATGFEKVVIIGSDCPGLTHSLLRQAFRLLDECEVVIGPSRDGGYYLLGMTTYRPALFDRKKWSTSAVCRQTIHQLEEREISYRLLPVLNDIDTEQDLSQSRHLSLL